MLIPVHTMQVKDTVAISPVVTQGWTALIVGQSEKLSMLFDTFSYLVMYTKCDWWLFSLGVIVVYLGLD